MGVLITKALLVRVYILGPEFGKLPSGPCGACAVKLAQELREHEPLFTRSCNVPGALFSDGSKSRKMQNSRRTDDIRQFCSGLCCISSVETW